MTDQFGRPYDLDQSGRGFHKSRSYLGPSLGWVETQILPELKINAGGTYQIKPGDSVVLLEAGTPTTFLLPDVKAWQAQNATQPATGFARGLFFKDYAGNSLTIHITLVPFDSQTIDGLNQSFILAQNFGIIALFPMVDGTGWWLAPMTYDTGTGGTTAINPTPPITGNVVGNVMNVGFNFLPAQFQVIGGQFALQSMAPGLVFGNPSAVAATPIGASLTDMFDRAFTPNQGSILFRSNAAWVPLLPGTSGQSLVSGGIGGNPSWQTVVGGNVSNNGVPTNGQIAQWVDATHIKGVNKSSLGFVQPSGPITSQYLTYWPDATGQNISAALPGDGLLFAASILSVNFAEVQRQDPDLDALAALTGTNTIYYRSGVSTWSPVTIGANMSFSGGVLNSIGGGGGGNVTASGVPTNGQIAQWTSATAIQGINAPWTKAAGPITSQFLAYWSDATGLNLSAASPGVGIDLAGSVLAVNFNEVQAHNADLDSLSNLLVGDVQKIFYRFGVGDWRPVTIGTGLAFSTGTLSATGGGGGGNVSNSGTPTAGQLASWTDATHIAGIAPSSLGFAPINNPGFTGVPTAPTPATADNSTKIATTAYVQAQGYLTAAQGAALYQPLDADLSSLAAAAGTNTIYYRSGVGTWSPVTIGGNMTFAGGTLDAVGGGGGGGNVSNSGTPTAGQWAQWTSATTIQGVGTGATPFVQKSGDAMTGSLSMTQSAGITLTMTAAAGSTSFIMDAATAQQNGITGRKLGSTRWQILIGNPDAETGLNQGSHFQIDRYTDGGTIINTGQTFKIMRESGNILIGNNTNAGAAQAKLQVHGQDCLSLFNWAAATNPPVLAFHHSRSATVGTIAPVADGDSLGLITFLGAGTTGFGLGAQIQSLVMGTPSANLIPGGFGMDTRPVGGSMTRRLTVTSAGSIVVGPMPFALANGILEINNESALGLGGAFWNKWSNDGAGFELYLRKSRGLTSNIFAAVQAGDNIGSIFFLGAVASGFVPAGSIAVDATGAPVTGVPSTMRFNISTASAGSITCLLLDPVNGQNILGTTLANNASAGMVGEYMQAGVSETAFATPPSGTPGVFASLSLTPGDWDVEAIMCFRNPAASSTFWGISITTSTNSFDTTGVGRSATVYSGAIASYAVQGALAARISVAVTTTYNLVYVCGQAGSQASGIFKARRRR